MWQYVQATEVQVDDTVRATLWYATVQAIEIDGEKVVLHVKSTVTGIKHRITYWKWDKVAVRQSLEKLL